MADEEKAAGKAPPVRKFKPTVGQRRVKQEDGSTSGAPSAVDAAAANDAFKDLMAAAKSEASWERGRGRGRGRGQMRFQVTFGGGGQERVALPTRKGYAPRLGGLHGGPGGHGGGHHGGGGGGTRASGAGPSTADGADAMEIEDELEPAYQYQPKVKPKQELLDYRQYYPTILPLRAPHAELYDDNESQEWTPQDLAVVHDEPSNAAEQLGLLDLNNQAEDLFLVQMPSILPVASSHLRGGLDGDDRESGHPRRRGAASASDSSKPQCAGMKELTSGRIGKLLVFKSGKIKMQIGDVLMDVNMGVPTQHRQDIAVVNHNAGHCVLLGSVQERVVVSPDVWHLMSGDAVPDWRRDLLKGKDSGDAEAPTKSSNIKAEHAPG